MDSEGVSGCGSGSVNNRTLIVILTGPPASGKSTFCQEVIDGACRPWTRICQDIIANGKQGNKSQCLKQASEALNEGQSVIIDRCNLRKEQRHEFVQLAGPQTEVHAVVLDLPAKLCIGRVVKRTGHEGGLQGGKAAAVINKMLQTKEAPALTEGFSRITFCQTEADVENAINMYKKLGPADDLPSGIHGQKSNNDKTQSGMLRFFKKENDTQKSDSDKKSSELLKSQQIINKNPEILDGKDTEQIISGCRHLDRTSTKSSAVQSNDCICSGVPENDSVPTLAFPSISTSDFRFDHEKAANIIVEKVSEFLRSYTNLNFRLAFVDLTEESDMLRRVFSKAAEKGLNSQRFFTVVGDITKLYSKGGLKCNVIANAANWRLKAGGGGVNAAIFKAAGPELEDATKERAKTLSPGSALVVPLSMCNPLYKNEGVTHVIHVLGPNMNPQRPNCLGGDYAKGCKILCDTYSSLFRSFLSIIKARKCSIPTQEFHHSESLVKEIPAVKSNQANETGVSGTRNAFAVLMQSSKKYNSCESDKKLKRQDLPGPEVNKRLKMETTEHLPETDECALRDETSGLGLNFSSSCFSGDKTGIGSTTTHKDQIAEHNVGKNIKGKKPWDMWAQALHDVALYPEQNSRVLEFTDSVAVLPDLYPKAKRHVLIVARLDGLDSLADVQKEHLPLLREIHFKGEKWATSFLHDDPTLIFRLGYHSVPSMRQLHMHVISQDFDSVHLKNKKHWNSFTTNFFRDSVDVLEEVEKVGKVDIIWDKHILSMELRCHRCRSAHPNIHRLKSHISTCDKTSIGSTTTCKDQIARHNVGKNIKGKKPWEVWAQALHEVALYPEQNSRVLEFTDKVVVLSDLYPKAKRHVLIVARLDGLDSLADVQKEHLPLLREIHLKGEKWATSFLHDDPTLIFRLGYHSVPSMRQLHMHVISQDFDSVHLKNKKHWNSFTTNFFRDSVDILEEVEKVGKADIIWDKDILSMELRCHRCRSAHPNIPRLKSHISTCKAPFPESISGGRHLFSLSEVIPR